MKLYFQSNDTRERTGGSGRYFAVICTRVGRKNRIVKNEWTRHTPSRSRRVNPSTQTPYTLVPWSL